MRWIGTGFYLVGMTLSAFGYYPWYLPFNLAGGCIWAYCALHLYKDNALFLPEAYAAAICLAGILLYARA